MEKQKPGKGVGCLVIVVLSALLLGAIMFCSSSTGPETPADERADALDRLKFYADKAQRPDVTLSTLVDMCSSAYLARDAVRAHHRSVDDPDAQMLQDATLIVGIQDLISDCETRDVPNYLELKAMNDIQKTAHANRLGVGAGN